MHQPALATIAMLKHHIYMHRSMIYDTSYDTHEVILLAC